MTINDPFHCLSAGLVIAFVASVSPAATLTMTAVPVARYSDDFIYSLPFTNTFDPGIYQIDFAFTISNVAANERGFGALAFNVDLGGLVDPIGWQPFQETVDCGCPRPGGIVPPFVINRDAGPNPTDLQDIIVAVVAGLTDPGDPRTKLGQGGQPQYFGSLYLNYDGVGRRIMTVNNLRFVTTDLGGLLNTTEQFATGPMVAFGLIPEPATLALVVSAIIALASTLCCRGFDRKAREGIAPC